MEIINKYERIQENVFWVLKLCVGVTEKHIIRLLHNASFLNLVISLLRQSHGLTSSKSVLEKGVSGRPPLR